DARGAHWDAGGGPLRVRSARRGASLPRRRRASSERARLRGHGHARGRPRPDRGLAARAHRRPGAERTPARAFVSAGRVRVLRVIGRLNMGGPAQHVTILSGRLDPARYETLLVAGRVGPGEASAAHLADERGAQLVQLEDLGPQIRPWADIRALVQLIRIIRRLRPEIVHTHTAKA